MAAAWIDLFEALSADDFQEQSGLIVSTRFHRNSKYAIFEIVAFQAVNSIVRSGDESVSFNSDGYKVFIIYEPATYPTRFQEPYLREPDQQVPFRFSELEVFDLSNHDRILINREPYTSTGSFTVEAPGEGNFSTFIYDRGNLEDITGDYIRDILHEDFNVPDRILNDLMGVLNQNLAKFRSQAG